MVHSTLKVFDRLWFNRKLNSSKMELDFWSLTIELGDEPLTVVALFTGRGITYLIKVNNRSEEGE